MLVLAIESSFSTLGVALLQDCDVLAEVFSGEGVANRDRLALIIGELLSAHGRRPSDIGGVAVSIGPGSYTSCRIGVTTAKTLAFALQVPVAGISSLEVLAASALAASSRGSHGAARECRRLLTFMDALRGRVYSAAFAAASGETREESRRPIPRRIAPDRILSLDEAALLVPEASHATGDAAPAVLARAAALQEAGAPAGGLGPAPSSRAPQAIAVAPSAASLGAIALPRLAAAGRFDAAAVHSLEPVYLGAAAPQPRRPKTETRRELGAESRKE